MKRATIIVVGVFVLLLVVFLATREREVSVGVRRLELPQIEKDKVIAVEVSGAKSASLKKEGAGWTVADPAKPEQKHPADETQVNSALDALKELKAQDLISDKAERQAEYETDETKGLRVKIVSQAAPPLDLVVGKSAKGGGVYLRKASEKATYVAQGRFQWLVRKDVNGWRKRAILNLKPEEISELSVHPAGGEPYVIEAKTEGGGWILKEGTKLPPGFRFDSSAAQGSVQQFASIRAQDFLDAPPSDESLGLSGEHTVLEARLKDGKKLVLHLGKEYEGKDVQTKGAVAARMEGDPQVYLVPKYSATNLSRKASDLRDLTLLSFDPQKATKVVIHSPGKRTVVVKEGDSWRIVEPKKLPAGFEFDPGQVQSQLQMLKALRASHVVESPASPAQTGLARPTTTVDIAVEGGTTQSLRFGKELKSDKGKEAYVKGSADNLTYAIYDAARTRFETGIELFKKPPPPPPSAGGGMRGLENLPPDVRQKIEAQLRAQQRP
jgi:uncharacterized protein DUF4340